MSYSQFSIFHSHVRLNVWERTGAGAPLLFSHATNFHGRIWSEVIDRLPGRHCYALDHRGHGQSDKPAPPNNWRGFAEDVAALARSLGLRGAVGIGHSMGGHSLALAAALAPECFATLLLIDPTIQPREWYGGPVVREHGVARRRNQWSSPEEMFDRFKDRLPFSRWNADVLRDYCVYGLLPAPDGDGFVLACPPAFEAGIYTTFRTTDIYDEIGTIQIPVHIVRSGSVLTADRTEMSSSATNPTLVRSFPHAFDVHLPGYSHFLPMEAPDWVAAYISGILDTQPSRE